MTFFLHDHGTYRTASKESLDIKEQLPTGVYTVKKDMIGYFLESAAAFSLPSRLYGNTCAVIDRVWKTYLHREGSTGVILSGLKGSGKTLTTKGISLRGLENGTITIIVNQAYCDTSFSQVISSIEQPCIVIVDEFEKVYNSEEQSGLLSLLDGLYNSKKLFLFTTNNQWGLSNFMYNRPSRVFYHVKFEGLSDQFVREYCQDNLKNQSHVEAVVVFFQGIGQSNFDQLQAVVEEMNRYDEPVAAAVQLMNIDFEVEVTSYKAVSVSHALYAIQVDPGQTVNLRLSDPHNSFGLHVSKIKDPDEIKPTKKRGEDDDDDDDGEGEEDDESDGFTGYPVFDMGDLKLSEDSHKVLSFENEDGYKVRLERKPKRASYNFKHRMLDY